MEAYLASDHCKSMDREWANRYKNRCGGYSDCLDIVIPDDGFKLKPV